jgi:hypothetical protein
MKKLHLRVSTKSLTVTLATAAAALTGLACYLDCGGQELCAEVGTFIRLIPDGTSCPDYEVLQSDLYQSVPTDVGLEPCPTARVGFSSTAFEYAASTQRRYRNFIVYLGGCVTTGTQDDYGAIWWTCYNKSASGELCPHNQ